MARRRRNTDSDGWDNTEEFWSSDGHMGKMTTRWDGFDGELSLEGHDSNGDGTFDYPTVSYISERRGDGERALKAAARRVKRAFEAGKIYVPNAFEEPYHRAVHTARVTFMSVADPEYV
jgi:hypothetical protein